jgi:non-homologous end joining protein Ku
MTCRIETNDKLSPTDQQRQDFRRMTLMTTWIGPQAVSRIALRPHDPSTGEEIEREQVAKGCEYQRGQFVTFTAEDPNALDFESPKVIDLEKLHSAVT